MAVGGGDVSTAGEDGSASEDGSDGDSASDLLLLEMEQKVSDNHDDENQLTEIEGV